MKTLFKLTPILFLFLATACSKDKSVGNESLVNGKWKLIETLADPGDGSGKWQPVNNNTFSDNIRFKENGKVEWDQNKEFITYSIKDSVTLSFVRADKSVQTYFYQIKGNQLTMSPDWPVRCIEACGSKYVKTR